MIGRRWWVLGALVVLLAGPAGAQTASGTTSDGTGGSAASPSTQAPATQARAAEPYLDSEFPKWSRDLRRAEIIAVGAFPLTFLFAGLGYDSYYYVSQGFPSANIPWPAGPGTSQWTTSDHPEELKAKNLVLLGTAAVASLAIAAADWWWGR